MLYLPVTAMDRSLVGRCVIASTKSPSWGEIEMPSGEDVMLCVLGRFTLRSGGREILVSGLKSRALLAYLACNAGKPHSREKLIGLLWGERFDQQARQSLRQSLSTLRGILGADLIEADRNEVSLNDELRSDVSAFVNLAVSKNREHLAEALRLYQGPLLNGFSLSENAFVDWLTAERARLRDLALDALDALMQREEKQPTATLLLAFAQQAVALDPYRESAHRHLLRALARLGRRSDAMMHFRQLEHVLESDLGVRVDASTQEIVEAIRSELLVADPLDSEDAAAPAHDSESAVHLPDEPAYPVFLLSGQLGATSTKLRHSSRSSGKPSIVVLPFASAGDKAQQDYFSDGVTEAIITELSRDHSLLVIAGNSAFQCRGPSVQIAALRHKLNVQYVLEGSVRKVGTRLRVAVQLIDAETESHVWADRFERKQKDVFALQDEIARTIAATLGGRVAARDLERSRSRPIADWAAYDYFLQGRDRTSQYRMAEAESLFARAIELYPDYVHAHAWRAIALAAKYGVDGREETIHEALACAQRALELDENDAWSQQAMGYVSLRRCQHELAGIHFDRAISLNPNDVNIAADRANWLMHVGRFDEALRSLDLAMQRNSYPPSWVWDVRGGVLFHMRRYDEAIEALCNISVPQRCSPAVLAAAYVQAGRIDEACSEIAAFRAVAPNTTISDVVRPGDYADPTLAEPWIDALRKAGLPEK
jgi:adenylate cyclase